MSSRAAKPQGRHPWPRHLLARAPDEIVHELATVPHPDVARDPDESLAVLDRLIREARAAAKVRRRGEEPTYVREGPELSAAMKMLETAPAAALRKSMKLVVDLLRDAGRSTSKAGPRRLDFEQPRDGAAIVHDISSEIRRRPFRLFPREKWDE